MKYLIGTFIAATALFSCNKCDEEKEKWIVQNDSDYSIVIKSYDNGQITFEGKADSKGSISIPYDNVENIMNSLVISHNDSTRVIFDETKKLNMTAQLQTGYDYEVSDCVHKKAQKCCTRTYTITNEHYEQAENI